MKRTALALMAVMGLMCTAALAEDFNLVAYTGDYVTAYPGPGTIDNLAYIPVGPNGWQRVTMPDGSAKQHEIFLFISTDFTDKGVGGIDLNDGSTAPVSGIFGDETFVTINNLARWQKSGWTRVDTQADADYYDNYQGYGASENDTWYFTPFGQFALGAVTEDPSPPPAGEYGGNFYKGVGLQWNSTDGWTDEDLGKGGVLNQVPYIHLVINKEAMPCRTLTWITIAGLPALINGQRPSSYDWLGKTIADLPAPWVPTGKIEIYCTPEPASIAVLALAAVPFLLRRRK